jgi:hypothetical protein
MGRLSTVFLLIAVLGLAGLSSPPAASPDPAARSLSNWVEFRLRWPGGFAISVEGDGSPITLRVRRGFQETSYSVPGSVSDRGVFARFGRLGRIAVEFRPRRRAAACEKRLFAPRGIFAGTIRFDGEGGYVNVDAERARGTLSAFGPLACRHRMRPSLHAAASEPEGREPEEASYATLTAVTPGARRVLVAIGVRSADGSSESFIGGERRERRGRMRIERTSSVASRNDVFIFDSALRSATLQPPPPFQGSASFERAAGGSTRWTGSLSLALLGAKPVRLTGAAFTVRLKRELAGLTDG